jgi:hypothetical protein
MYDPGAILPSAYDGFHIVVFKDRISGSHAWNKLAVVAHRDDPATMLNHALIQARRRGDV